MNTFDIAHSAHGRQMTPGLPARTKDSERGGVVTGEVARSQSAARCYPHPLNDAVRKHGEGFAVRSREQHDQTDVLIAGSGGDFRFDHSTALLMPANDIGVDTHRYDRRIVKPRLHGLKGVDSGLAGRWHDQIGARPVDSFSFIPVCIGFLQSLDALVDGRNDSISSLLSISMLAGISTPESDVKHCRHAGIGLTCIRPTLAA